MDFAQISNLTQRGFLRPKLFMSSRHVLTGEISSNASHSGTLRGQRYFQTFFIVACLGVVQLFV